MRRLKKSKKSKNVTSGTSHSRVIPSCELKVLPQFKTYFGYCLYKSAMRFRAQMDAALSQHQIITPQMGILRLINDVGPQSQQDLGHMLGIDKASMVKFLDGLQRVKMVMRKSHGVDRRIKLIESTAKGRKLLVEAAKMREKIETEFLSPLTPEERAVLKTAMPKLLR